MPARLTPPARASATRPQRKTRPQPSQQPAPPPPIAVARPAPAVAEHFAGPRAAIIIDDLGQSLTHLEQLASLDITLSIAVIPGLPATSRTVSEASRRGIEMLLHQPMEPREEGGRTPAVGSAASMSTKALRAQVRANLADVPGAVGVNNHMGSRFTEDAAGLGALMAELKEHGLFWLDSRTTPGTRGAQVAHAAGVPALERDIFLDAETNVDFIRRQVHKLIETARIHGTAVASATRTPRRSRFYARCAQSCSPPASPWSPSPRSCGAPPGPLPRSPRHWRARGAGQACGHPENRHTMRTPAPGTRGLLILGIETSCDETAAAVVEKGRRVLSSAVASQVADHRPYGGVVPEIAGRKHLENLVPVVQSALTEAGVTPADIGAVAVTSSPGLMGALLVGTSFGKALAMGWGVPLVEVNHLHAHALAINLGARRPRPPFLALVVSGGHTTLFRVSSALDLAILGQTRDDAAGECIDKVAKFLGLGYPGGPEIDRLAAGANPRAVRFTRGLAHASTLDFSFSGLKTAVVNHVLGTSRLDGPLNHQRMPSIPDGELRDLVASFLEAVVDTLVDKTLRAAREHGLSTVVVSGGVAANTRLREKMTAAEKRQACGFCSPDANCAPTMRR